MPRRTPQLPDNIQDIGWRLRQLRLHRGLSLRALAEKAGKHASQLSRIERSDARRGQPKPSTIEQLLDALDATPGERNAILHIEPPELTPAEIKEQLQLAEAAYGMSTIAIGLLDEHWYVRYLNPAARMLFGLSHAEYEATLGSNGILQTIDPKAPMYSRYPEEERKHVFSLWAAAFQFHFAYQQYDRWYQRVVSAIHRIAWAQNIWLAPPDMPLLVDSQIMPFQNPEVGLLILRLQLNQILAAPRFYLLEMTAADEDASGKISNLQRGVLSPFE